MHPRYKVGLIPEQSARSFKIWFEVPEFVELDSVYDICSPTLIAYECWDLTKYK